MRIPWLIALGIVVATMPALATPACGDHTVVLGFGGTIYVAWDGAGSSLLPPWRLYAEKNGMPGLQRGGSSLLLSEADYCVQSSDPDQAIAFGGTYG